MADLADDTARQPLGEGLDPALVAAADPAGAARGGDRRGLSLGAVSWAVHEGGRDPYVIMVTIYIFGPYFAAAFAGGGAKGQETVAFITTCYGLLTAITAPFLGSAVQLMGRRKPLLFLIVALMAPLIFALWWAKPDHTGLTLPILEVMLFVIPTLFAYGEMIHNAMLTSAATPVERPGASGLALALGNFVSTFMLVFVLWGFVLPGAVHWSFVPAHPLFGLDPAKHEPERIVGPIVAVVLALGSIPMFLFTRDAPSSGIKVGEAFRQGAGALFETVKSLGTDRNAALYLGSRMLYTDGMTALLAIGGVYAAGVMHWATLDLLVYGILLSVAAVGGGLLAGWMDATFGPRQAVRIEILGAFIALVGQLSMGRDHMFFVIPYDAVAHAPLWNGPMFRTLPEVVYLLIGLGTAVFVTGQYASSRTLLTRLVPEEKTASFFGLYALSGTVTAWLGSFLVGAATHVSGAQQAGFAPIAFLLAVGFVGMLFVKGGGVLGSDPR
jgi:UMF1 family MFS transporter